MRSDRVDALVIGSGFAGGVAALRLAEAGIGVVVLERGRRWPVDGISEVFATRRAPDARAHWMSTAERYAGVLEIREENGIRAMCGAGVGGGSLVYTGMLLRAYPDALTRMFRGLVDPDEMASVFYPRVAEQLKPSPIPDDVLATEAYRSTRAFMSDIRRSDLPWRMLDLGVDWDRVRDELRGTRTASLADGESYFGNNSGAKLTIDMTYLAAAERTGHVEVLPLHVVAAIAERRGEGYAVSVDRIDDNGVVLERREIVTRRLFLAAGALGTTGLLVQARAEKGLERLSDAVGADVGTNGNNTSWRASSETVTNPMAGGPAGIYVGPIDTPHGRVAFANTPGPPFVPDPIPEGDVFLFGMGMPGKLGRMTWDEGTRSARLVWPSDASENVRMTEAVRFAHARMDDAIGVKRPARFVNPHRIAGHLLGGCVLGRACDDVGRVHGYEGLYVIDSALVPGHCGCVNPAMTVAALAERNVSRIIERDLARAVI